MRPNLSLSTGTLVVPTADVFSGVTSCAMRYTTHTRSVYDMCMGRTNLLIDDELVDLVMRRYALHTKTAAVDLALRHLAGRPMATNEALAMRGARAILDVPADQAPE